MVFSIERTPARVQCFTESLEALANDAIPLDMVLVSGGTFTMGSPTTEPQRADSEGPQREVTLPGFFMGRYPVTQAQWRAVATRLPQLKQPLNPDPSEFNGDDRPVEQVSWVEAVEFCDRLAVATKRAYRLPSEAEWEYACRAGTTTPFAFGKTLTTEIANYRGDYTYNGGPTGEYRKETTPVNFFGVANEWGLCDMHGNVWEWCGDHWHDDYAGAPSDGSAWLTDDDKAYRVVRGGSWDFNPRYCRSATRRYDRPDDRGPEIGFRICCAAPRILQAPAS